MIRASLALSSDNLAEPLQLDAAMDFCRVTDAEEIPELERTIHAARRHVENLTGRALTLQTWVLTAEDWHHIYDCRDARTIELRRTPLVSVTSVKYYDAATGVLTTWDSANYHVLTGFSPGRIVRDADSSWPNVDDRPDAVQITFVAGYAEVANVPGEHTRAVAYLTRHFYDNRHLASEQRMQALPHTFDALIDTLRVGGWAQ